MLLAIATRYTQMEDGKLARALPVARPAPKKVIGGALLELAEVEALSYLDLVQRIEAVVTSKPLVRAMCANYRACSRLNQHPPVLPGDKHSCGQHFRGHSRGPREADACDNHREGARAGDQGHPKCRKAWCCAEIVLRRLDKHANSKHEFSQFLPVVDSRNFRYRPWAGDVQC
ncbi:hypothetical protein N9L68_03115 [bacterium]|nr:hypothetical protein [bacterium]